MDEATSPGRQNLDAKHKLTRFLELELEVTRTMLDLARTEDREPRDPHGLQQALENARKSLTTIFDFLPRLGQCTAAEAIATTAHALQAELGSFSRSCR
jgi:hypothetical protein